ncbi:MAG: hypothetical protein KAJ51_16215 [Thermoplasmata archaeon]|nr:hypothetical protein [Thermoplasmata archaeon]
MEIEIEEVKVEDEDLQIIKLKSDGWEKVGDPVSFQMNKTRDEIRAWAKAYASKFNAEKLIEIEIPSETPDQENTLKYHAFKKGGATPAAPAATPVMAQPVAQPPPPPVPEPAQPTQAAPVYAPEPTPTPAPAPEPVPAPAPGPPQPRAFGCPYCGKAFAAIPINEAQLVACPSCGGGNIIPPLEQLSAPEVSPEAYQQAPSPSETQQLSIPPQGQYQQPGAQQQDPLFNQYATSEVAIDDLVSKLADLLVRDDCPLTFKDTGEFMYPKVTIRREAYDHMGTRTMDLILIKDGVHDFKIIGNEVHGTSGGAITPMRDELFSIKTLGHASSMPLQDYKVLEDEQKYHIAKALFLFVNEARRKIGL